MDFKSKFVREISTGNGSEYTNSDHITEDQAVDMLRHFDPFVKSKRIWVHCPYHTSSQGRRDYTFNLDVNKKVPWLHGRCWGCGKPSSMSFHDFCKDHGIGFPKDWDSVVKMRTRRSSSVFSRKDDSTSFHRKFLKLKKNFLWPLKSGWRGLTKKHLKEQGIFLINDPYINQNSGEARRIRNLLKMTHPKEEYESYYTKKLMVFPVKEEGKVVGAILAREYHKDEKQNPKYLNTGGSLTNFYFYPELDYNQDYVIVVEGPYCAHLLRQKGIHGVSNTGVHMSDLKVRYLSHFSDVIMAFDNDKPGRMAVLGSDDFEDSSESSPGLLDMISKVTCAHHFEFKGKYVIKKKSKKVKDFGDCFDFHNMKDVKRIKKLVRRIQNE